MVTKINFDGENRLAVILPKHSSDLDENVFKKMSIFLNLIVGNYGHKMSTDILCLTCDLALALGNSVKKKTNDKKLILSK